MGTTYHEPAREIPIYDEYDVTVVRGGSAGLAAALASACGRGDSGRDTAVLSRTSRPRRADPPRACLVSLAARPAERTERRRRTRHRGYRGRGAAIYAVRRAHSRRGAGAARQVGALGESGSVHWWKGPIGSGDRVAGGPTSSFTTPTMPSFRESSVPARHGASRGISFEDARGSARCKVTTT